MACELRKKTAMEEGYQKMIDKRARILEIK